jgi:hypothetical protein
MKLDYLTVKNAIADCGELVQTTERDRYFIDVIVNGKRRYASRMIIWGGIPQKITYFFSLSEALDWAEKRRSQLGANRTLRATQCSTCEILEFPLHRRNEKTALYQGLLEHEL